MENEERKLAAIMFTDMVGYSAMAQKNEELSLALLEKHRNIIRSILLSHKGKEIKTIGDAFLLEFGSALDAVNCSISIQEAFQKYNQDCPAEQKILLRIGIHLGDVISRDGDIYGDGVNISSRIESLARPGGICISEDVARQVQGKMNVPLRKLGKPELKNIQLPMEIYQLVLEKQSADESTPVENNKLAVLPFQNISPEKESDYFSDGLTEELIMNLSGIKELKVVSRTTSMLYKDTQKDLVFIGRELKARYILEGSVRRHVNDLRITAQLIDVETDSHLWAETYRGDMADIFDIQESVAKQIVTALRVTLSPAEKVALGKRATLNTEAFDLNLHAREFLYRQTKSYLLFAIDLFQKALEQDSRYAPAYAGLGEAYALLYQMHGSKPELLDQALESSFKALMYDANSSEAYGAIGLVYYNKHSNEEALTATQKAIELAADNYFAYWVQGRIYRMLGRNVEAVEQFNKVLELNPEYYTAYADLRMAYTMLGDSDKELETSERAVRFFPAYLLRHPDDVRAYLFFASCLQFVERNDEARMQMSRALELSPNDAIVLYNAACFYSNMGEKSLAIETLQRAFASGYDNREYIKLDPDFNNIREEAGYLELMKEG